MRHEWMEAVQKLVPKPIQRSPPLPMQEQPSSQRRALARPCAAKVDLSPFRPPSLQLRQKYGRRLQTLSIDCFALNDSGGDRCRGGWRKGGCCRRQGRGRRCGGSRSRSAVLEEVLGGREVLGGTAGHGRARSRHAAHGKPGSGRDNGDRRPDQDTSLDGCACSHAFRIYAPALFGLRPAWLAWAGCSSRYGVLLVDPVDPVLPVFITRLLAKTPGDQAQALPALHSCLACSRRHLRVDGGGITIGGL
jgi:hypothetical protein